MKHLGFLLVVTITISAVRNVISLKPAAERMAADYFHFKNVKFVCYFSCEIQHYNMQLVRKLFEHDIRISVKDIREDTTYKPIFLTYRKVSVGVLLDGNCDNIIPILNEASRYKQFDAMHVWLVLSNENGNNALDFVNEHFCDLNLSVNADIVVADYRGTHYLFTDVYNFGRIQGNHLERVSAGTWTEASGVRLAVKGFQYYNRWDFHNLTLRAVSVIRDRPNTFYPEMLTDIQYTAGISSMTKIVAQLLKLLMEQHNFRFNYTIVGRWIGEPARNSTKAVTNTLFWGEQDISCTCARIFPKWLEWVDIFYPPATNLETKFYYLIPDKGVGDYENRFLSPLSAGVWWGSFAAGILCILVLTVASLFESRPQAAIYAFFSVLAAICQQAYDDFQTLEERFSSQGRRVTLLVIGLTSMLLYNYYTSSVVSWLLNAAAPTIATMDGLINSDLQLIFEDIGYTRGWLDNPGFFYYSGYKNVKEDELREKKVTRAKRTVPLMQRVEDGIELVRKGGFAYHTEPYTANQVISKTFEDRELCALGSLQMMAPAYVYIMAQKQSPYKEFFIWSLMRLFERGHYTASRARVAAVTPACSGSTPRALALGQAAPAFFLFFLLILLAVFILIIEIIWHRMEQKKQAAINRSTYKKSIAPRRGRVIANITHRATLRT
uniref:Ionotropic receptor 1 n=1 Tax=Galleria mellonella TaxID=7137 RepID=A0A5C0E4F6_GALME|nr:ionotropic receptor 1 [Galleria mellonella]